MTELRPMKEDPGVSDSLRADLERVQGIVPHAYDASAGLARLQSAMAVTATVASTSATVWPWIAAAGVVSVALIGVVVTRSGEDANPPAARPVPALAAPAIPVVEPSAPLNVATPTPTPSPTPAHDIDDVAQEAAAPTTPPEREIDPDALLRMETAHLARARDALQTSAADALRLARQGQRRFPGGMFGQERSAIIVLASLQLGSPHAVESARAFLADYPHGPLSDRIREELSRPREAP